MIIRVKLLLSMVGIALLVVLALWTPLLAAVRGRVWQAIIVATARGWQVGAINVTPDVMDQLAQLRADNVRLGAELAHFEKLAVQLGTPQYRDFRVLPAIVAARPVDTFRSRYVLNRGTRDGVSLGTPVVINGSDLVGFVVELSPETSVLQLLLHPETRVTAEVVPHDEGEQRRARGLVVGAHYTSAVLTTVPRDQAIASGESVVTVVSEGTVPAGLVVGKIGEIRSQESEAYQRATLDLPYDPDDLQAVALLLPVAS